MDILYSLGHPEEIYNLFRFKMGGCRAVMPKLNRNTMSESLQACYRYMNETSRSYSAVIQTLDGELRKPVCITYLITRALDTVEDDMTIKLETKILILQNLHTYLYDPKWKFTKSKEKHRQVLENFPMISLEFRNLAAVYQEIIVDMCNKIGEYMADFLEKEIDSLKDWEKYCYCVGGLLGVALSRILSASELEDPIVGQDTQLAVSMGLFLQKTNNIRDYLEDQLNGQGFWPREVWSKYGKKLSDLAKPENIEPAVQCLNKLITNALQHVPDVLTYLSRLKNQSVFNFCAIPQVMAIATLAACYNNQQVFKGVVKIRKGQAVTLMMNTTNIEAVKATMFQYTEEIRQKIPPGDPSLEETQQRVLSIQNLCVPHGSSGLSNHLSSIHLLYGVILAVLGYQYLSHVSVSFCLILWESDHVDDFLNGFTNVGEEESIVENIKCIVCYKHSLILHRTR
ncbi:squalene synthase-like [Pelobates fuscus]|uniref:squalene synthase-like n=1 Tax=Pelobates fuscus TaxID=191477 RepID=UPI002FE4CE9A